jgi:hypothetical protein
LFSRILHDKQYFPYPEQHAKAQQYFMDQGCQILYLSLDVLKLEKLNLSNFNIGSVSESFLSLYLN